MNTYRSEMFRSSRIVSGMFACALCLSGACDSNAPSSRPSPTAKPPAVAARVAEARPEVFKVPVGDSPAKGGQAPKVTLVVFSEFECPFCAKAAPTLEELSRRYRDDLQIVWKHLPLPFHERAVPAALAAEAARREGKFWQMHDRLFSNQSALAAADLERHAEAVGLARGALSGALADVSAKARIEADRKLGETLGVRGTPTFFINGRRLVGAQPLERFVALIDDELVRADELLRSGVARGGLYAALTAGGLEKAVVEAPPAPAGAGPCAGGNCPNQGGGNAAPDPSRDATVHKVELGGAPTRGPADAPITVVLFSDFECPFCKKVEATIAELERAFPGKIRIAWKNYPLPFHTNARAAALLAMAAHRRGKFWAMHDALLADQRALGRADLERHAEPLGLSGELAAALGSAELAAAIEADVKQGEALGVTGTPTVFLNGRRVVGAFPLATFRAIVEQELAKRGG